ncbi:5-deoxy-glucuronate isomerase (plasmid) [Deinococcus metallilatus]|uniref:5-deoxy-glucuronate isomerase n=1 Tax=Deinococcus metallilatus TaxID=1211322 RepID=A0AAJ5F6G9_9DEIO|nr:5-deoxy-glucuronate isomerase [Deinococcus metallilatus]MBB5295632.1 5-deoxy-glucuronate isomerase [Deinococcus metallilatus]QBY06907.1 5-deoxy-glucuronate isomerase [Deinococcus metallilatus]TLK32297.1 5-deoxy-glucuronate isomerase [Deinococcus metallilatus]GMA14161.1 5-deoxy-glucuronate isomerase [Deinococcus metallilatus]
MTNHLRPDASGQVGVTPESAGWEYLSFGVVRLTPGQTHQANTGGNEVALVPQEGRLRVEAGGQTFDLTRRDVFSELPHVLYLPPGVAYRVSGEGVFAWGGAPASGALPLRLFRPEEMRVELRGGANATRQVSHILGPDLPAERLLLYEVYTPSGNWSGWPPHRHDGRLGSLYIEETYHYRVSPPQGWAVHRNYSPEDGEDELLLARDGDLILSRRGYHPVAAAPGSNVYYLNFMAGEAQGEQRRLPPVDEAQWAWMRQDWAGRAMPLPFPPPGLEG